MRSDIGFGRPKTDTFTVKKVIYAIFLLIAAAVCGCATFPKKLVVNDDYRDDSALAVEQALQDQGMTCFHSDLVILDKNGQSVIDPKRRKINCYSLEKKWFCPEKTSVTLIYNVESDAILSRTFSSKEKQCF